MKALYLSLASLTILALSSCSMFEQQYEGVNRDDSYQSYAAQRDGTFEAYDELGIDSTQKLSSDDRGKLQTRSRLVRLERNLTTKKEREQYYTYRPYLNDDSERITFLELPTVEARDRYAMSKGIYSRTGKFSPQIKKAITDSDIIVGMPKEAVMQSWGEPADRFVAGSEMYGNEKWTYTEMVPSNEGYQKEQRSVYFTNGKVSGWEKNVEQ